MKAAELLTLGTHRLSIVEELAELRPDPCAAECSRTEKRSA